MNGQLVKDADTNAYTDVADVDLGLGTGALAAAASSTAAANAALDHSTLLDFYANEQNAAGHILSLALWQLNQTTMGQQPSGFAFDNTRGSSPNLMGISNINMNPIGSGSSSSSGSINRSSGSIDISSHNISLIMSRLNGGGNISDSTINEMYYDSTDMETFAANGSSGAGAASAPTHAGTVEMPIWLIPSYGIILLFAIVGNSLVISTLVQNRRMRTITNLFLLNLAISDMLLGVLCMPVTLVGTLLRNFIFGESLCKLIQFAQAASVAVSSWTLVAISCERYYAICHPLRSRSWQTMSHAYRIIGFIWIGGILCMTPIAVFSQLMPTSRQGYRKCRENWPHAALGYERFYNLLLDLILLVLPLLILCVAYILITRTLYVGMQTTPTASGSCTVNESVAVEVTGGFKLLTRSTKRRQSNGHRKYAGHDSAAKAGGGHQQSGRASAAGATRYLPTETEVVICQHDEDGADADANGGGIADGAGDGSGVGSAVGAATAEPSAAGVAIDVSPLGLPNKNGGGQQQQQQTTVQKDARFRASPTLRVPDATLRRSNEAKTLESKKRVVKMLFVLVLEFFICWTPLYVINTSAMFIGPAIYEYVDYTSISFLQLLAYSSSCCNPITYCFMNASFRRAFVDTFKGLPMRGGKSGNSVVVGGSVGGGASSGSGWHSKRLKHELVSLTLAGNSLGTGHGPRL